MLTFDADVYFYYVCFFLCFWFVFGFLFWFVFFVCAAKFGFARKTAEGEYLNLHLNIKKKFYFSRTS